jgi:hypothetical protein
VRSWLLEKGVGERVCPDRNFSMVSEETIILFSENGNSVRDRDFSMVSDIYFQKSEMVFANEIE